MSHKLWKGTYLWWHILYTHIHLVTFTNIDQQIKVLQNEYLLCSILYGNEYFKTFSVH